HCGRALAREGPAVDHYSVTAVRGQRICHEQLRAVTLRDAVYRCLADYAISRSPERTPGTSMLFRAGAGGRRRGSEKASAMGQAEAFGHASVWGSADPSAGAPDTILSAGEDS